MKRLKFLALLLFFLISTIVYCSSKTVEIINDSWKFVLDEASQPSEVNWSSAKCVSIDLPHTWNNIDVTDDAPGYFRGIGWYKKELSVAVNLGRKYFINFEGANQVVRVYLNRSFVGTHTGGYSSFSFDITSFLKQDTTNILEVMVDNRHNENIPPLAGDFNFFGGIYRDVSIETKSEVYFTGGDFNGNGVYWQTPEVTEKSASVRLFGVIFNQSEATKTVVLKHQIKNRNSDIVATLSANEILKPGEFLNWESQTVEISNPILWSPENPYLYTIESFITDSGSGEMLDTKTNSLGFRWFSFDSNKGFFLNGNPVKLIGTSRHQDYPALGNALPKEIHHQDVKVLKELGFNFLRIAHYPQDPEVIKMCDQLGIICSVEIPVVNRITETPEFSETCKKMMQEMIWQNYNHPSLVIWAYMNEIMLQPRFEEDTLRQKEYFIHIAILAQDLENIARKLDPYRYTMIPNHSDFDLYNNYRLTQIPMLVGWNLYKGWYEVNYIGLDQFLDRHHAELPDKPLLITEYGAGNDPRLSSENPERFDCTNEYAILYHQYYLSAINKRSFVAGAFVWNLNDFSSNQKIDANPYLNNKGIHSFNRDPKETAWFYKANLLKQPFVNIFSPYGKELSGIEDQVKAKTSYKAINVYSNLDSINLFHNDTLIGIKPVKNGSATFIIPFTEGLNLITAKAIGRGKASQSDQSKINFSVIPRSFDQKEITNVEIRITCGDNRSIYDPEIKKIWLPDQKYIPGSWGYLGGKRYELETRRGLKPGSDQSILNTKLDPLYQTQRIDPIAYKFDTKPGRYEITLCFAQLDGSSKYDALKTKSKTAEITSNSQVCFDVLINGSIVLFNFSPGQNGVNTAINKKFIIDANEGIEIKFIPQKGKPIINGIVVEKI